MTLDDGILGEAKAAREALIELERQQEHARVDYHHAIRRLHAAGGSLREIADALGLSHQRVHQIVGEEPLIPMPAPYGPPTPPGLQQRVERQFRKRGGPRRGHFMHFAADARRAVVRAQDEARALRHGRVGTEHLLVAVVEHFPALAERGVTSDAVRERLVARLGEGTAAPRGQIHFTRAAKRVLERAFREALPGDDDIGIKHLLVGIASQPDCGGAGILRELGVDEDAVRGL